MVNVQLVYTIFYVTISFLLYFLTIFMIFKFWKEFNSSFFRIYVFNFFVNTTTYISSLFLSRIASFTCKNDCLFSSWFKNQSPENPGNYPLPTIYTVAIGCMFIQYSMIIIISINRLTVILMCKNIEEIWNTRILPIIYVILPVLPLIVTYPFFTHNAYFVYVDKSDSYMPTTVANHGQILGYVEFFMFFSTIVSAVLNFVGFFRLKKMQLQSSSKTGEKNMLYISSVHFIIETMALINFILLIIYITPENANSIGIKIIHMSLDFTYDLITLNAPWTLIIFSAKTRRYLRRIFGRQNPKKSSIFVSKVGNTTVS